ncbi:hypothetical protein SAMN04489761_3431 [Tenacibaculum sp. MAR_2009_124]|uniref:hypothetical protein n=1 Tax=Tenacibaculum sp. MAR_2009_124 TaxID=1250059 RepID=UPI00089C14CF|nr:hypothetical protein [Tenacibaculum sp. MAR_2009_124]SEC66202.1 hypothetical protein SAMN04489761_3431 [Tenacibaculum sp. MAR_2009_124]
MNYIIIAKSEKFNKTIHECEEVLLKGDRVVLESHNGNKYTFLISDRYYDPIKKEWMFATFPISGMSVDSVLEKYKKASL